MNDKWKISGVPAINRVEFCLNQAHEALRIALNAGNAVDALLILPFIKQTVELQNDIKNFINAKQED